ncbi:Haemin-degrading [Pedobacter sp. BAL39]|uniref:hemin-degrading factor n=1 Tax=Pedobacter sp. BAL39 TaxID=391596 RepID=UPI000155A3B6|nr:hemin-degrading factor [Pedobacter sp. BAL39]EDM34031.1 Haemin-degrading [Pedobacter sp. BAL39]
MEQTLTLKQRWKIFQAEHPKVRIRDAAKSLNSTEAELIATTVGSGTLRLNAQFPELLQEVESLGNVMALTRNDHCVHERQGVYTNLSFQGMMGLAVNPDIDLRLFMSQWKSGFAVDEDGRKSLQFFGPDGTALHKIYLTESSDVAAYETIIRKYKSEDQDAALVIEAAKAPATERPDAELNAEGFQQEWLDLKDTHAFHGLLRKYEMSRIQGLRLAPKGHARQITVPSVKKILEQVAADGIEIMVFTASAGCIQIHTGLIRKLLQTGPWFNVLDPEFNMHLREDGIATAWLVKKPTEDGLVTSIEVFDDAGNIIVQFFGKRKPGNPELEAWRYIANTLAEAP